MQITRTANGYAYDGWEACPGELDNGSKITPRECQSVVLKVAGLTYSEIGSVMGCGAENVKKMIASLYFKRRMPRGDIAKLVAELIDAGVLHRLALAALSVFILGASVSIDGERDMDARVVRTARGTRRNETDGLPIELLPVLDGRYA